VLFSSLVAHKLVVKIERFLPSFKQSSRISRRNWCGWVQSCQWPV